MNKEEKTMPEGTEERVRLALYEAVTLMDKYVVKKDLGSLWRLKLAINYAIRDLGLQDEWYHEAFFPILVCGKEPRLLKPGEVVDETEKLKEVIGALAANVGKEEGK